MENIKICAVGDIMPGGVYSASGRNISIDEELKNYIDDADIRLATLEAAIGNKETFIAGKVERLGDIVYAKDEDLNRLSELNINVVNLANNHIFDLGEGGISHVIELLDKMGVKHFGAGTTIEEAQRPAVFEVNGKSIAIIGYCDWRRETTGWCLMATETTPGVNPLFSDYEKHIRDLKSIYDYVVVVPHWGIEHSYWPTQHVVRHAKKMINAGADVIIGGHTHRAQPIIRYRNKVIAYSLGNFLFADRLINAPRSSWYPTDKDNKIDYRFIERTDGYPYVTEPTLVSFSENDKDGELLNVTLSENNISVDYELVYYTRSNKIQIQRSPINQTRQKLYLIGIMTKWKIYPYIIYPMYKFIYKLIKGVPFKFFALFSQKSLHSI